MGDVYDAMNRARKERGDIPDNEPPPAESTPRSEEPALPVDDVQPVEEPPSRTMLNALAVPGHSFSAAAEKNRAEHQSEPGDDNAAPDGRESVNGYSSEIVTHHDRGSEITEQYRAIRTQILARARNRRLQTTIVTSAAPAEGKTVTTINLGVAFSELRNQRTLLLECDFRRPTFARLLNRDATPGLAQLLKGEIDDVELATHPSVYPNLFYVPAGGRESVNSTELLSSPRMAQMIDRLKDRFDHIFIDTPPVINVTDASIVGAISDQTVLVVRLGKTPSDMVERAKRLLRAGNCEVAGVVLTHLVNPLPRYLYRYGSY